MGRDTLRIRCDIPSFYRCAESHTASRYLLTIPFKPFGYALSSLVLGSVKRLYYRGILLYIGSAIAGVGLGMFGLRLPLWALIVAALMNGAALEIVGLIWTTILQELVPQENLGRVVSIDTLGSFVLLPLGFAYTGWWIA